MSPRPAILRRLRHPEPWAGGCEESASPRTEAPTPTEPEGSQLQFQSGGRRHGLKLRPQQTRGVAASVSVGGASPWTEAPTPSGTRPSHAGSARGVRERRSSPRSGGICTAKSVSIDTLLESHAVQIPLSVAQILSLTHSPPPFAQDDGKGITRISAQPLRMTGRGSLILQRQ